MIKYYNEGANTYTIDTTTGIITNIDSGKTVEKVWAYPIKQAVWGASYNETHYFSSSDARKEYMACHDYCDALPRCKVMSDRIER